MPTRAVSASMGELESNLADVVCSSARTLPFYLDPASRQGFALRRGDACIQTAAKR
jgi:hypothetical protein